jgi:hypothetical protein
MINVLTKLIELLQSIKDCISVKKKKKTVDKSIL